MASNWMSNFAAVHHTYMPTDNSTNIDDLFKKKEDDKNVVKMIELKEILLNLIQNKEEIDLTTEETEEVEGSVKDEEKELVETIKEYMKNFSQLQDGLNETNEKFQSEIKALKDNISTIENMISFLKKLPEEHKEDKYIQNIIDNMNELSKTIEKNEKIKQIRKEYVQKRKEIEKYLQFIKQLNNFNQCNLCPVCFTNPVDHFVDPCGHTFCKECITSLRNNPELDLYEIGRNDNSQCCFCRERIKTIRQLYFL